MYLGGVQVSQRPGLGRVLVASKDFRPGEIVLQEQPLLVWEKQEGDIPFTLIQAFDSASLDVKRKIIDLYAPSPADFPNHSTVEMIKKALKEAQVKPEREQAILHLLLVCQCNVHSFLETNNAFFELGSKASHSCFPNVSYHSAESLCTLRYYTTTTAAACLCCCCGESPML